MLHVGRAAAPRPLGRRALQPPLRRRRRGARLPRRLRLARRERPAPPAAARPRLRRRAAVPARDRDDREPGRARRAAARRAGDGRRRTAAPSPSARSRSGTRRSSTRSSASAASALGEASRLMSQLVARGLRTICFAKSRKSAELIHRFTAERVDAETPGAAGAVPRRLHARAAARDRAAPRRGRAARRLRDGRARARDRHRRARLRDLGRLPGHRRVPAPAVGPRRPTRPRARRPRRERGRARPVLHARAGGAARRAGSRRRSSTTTNPRVLDGHVRAAAFEGPIDDADAETLGDEALERAAELPELERTPAGYVWNGRDYPAARVSLRSASPTPSRSSTSRPARCSASSSGARLLDRPRGRGLPPPRRAVPRARRSTSSRARRSSSAATVTGTRRRRRRPRRRSRSRCRTERRLGLDLHFGRVSVTEQVVAYQRRSIARRRRARDVPLDLPATTFDTEAVWFCPEPSSSPGSRRCRCCSRALHAAEHALIALLPLWAMCDRWDIGGLSTNVHFQTGRPTVFVYDGHAGGVGIAERGFERFEGWVDDTARMIDGLPVRGRLPLVRPEPEVRQPERPARQGRRADAAAPARSTAETVGTNRRETTDARRSASVPRQGNLGVPWGTRASAVRSPDRRCRFSRRPFVVVMQSNSEGRHE